MCRAAAFTCCAGPTRQGCCRGGLCSQSPALPRVRAEQLRLLLTGPITATAVPWAMFVCASEREELRKGNAVDVAWTRRSPPIPPQERLGAGAAARGKHRQSSSGQGLVGGSPVEMGHREAREERQRLSIMDWSLPGVPFPLHCTVQGKQMKVGREEGVLRLLLVVTAPVC